jgi:tetratricopeptide (TPR) repeat protein
MGRFSEAEALWQRALAIDPQNADSLFNLGQLAMETGKADQAQEYFERALRISPFNAKYKYFAGLNLIQSGLKNQAHSFWASGREQLNAEDPYARRILKALGEPQTNGRQADIADATTEMPVVHVPTSVIEEGPEDPDYTRALAYARAGYFNEAINGFRQVLLRNPSNFNALMNLGKVHAISGNAARSCALYLKALKLNPKNIFALRALANAYSETGLHSFAASITSQAEETHAGQTDGFPDYKASPAAVRNNPRAFKPVVTALLAEGLAHEAMAVIQSGLAQQQESAEMLLLKGDVDKELGRYDTALDAYRQAMSMEPQNPLPYLKTGDLLIAAGQFTNAADEYHKALKAGFIDPDTMFKIVDRFKQLGRSSDARRVLGRLKGMNLNQSQIAKLETHLGEQIEISQEDN